MTIFQSFLSRTGRGISIFQDFAEPPVFDNFGFYQCLLGPGTGPDETMAPTWDFGPGPDGAKAPTYFFGPAPTGPWLQLQFLAPDPSGAMAPFYKM